MAWQEPSEARAYCTGLAAASAPPRAGGSSTLNVCAPVVTSTSVTPTSVPSAVNSTCPLAGSLAMALLVSSISATSDMEAPRAGRVATPIHVATPHSRPFRPTLSRYAASGRTYGDVPPRASGGPRGVIPPDFIAPWAPRRGRGAGRGAGPGGGGSGSRRVPTTAGTRRGHSPCRDGSVNEPAVHDRTGKRPARGGCSYFLRFLSGRGKTWF